MELTRVLNQRALSRRRVLPGRGIEAGIVETFANVSPGREHESLVVVGNRRELVLNLPTLARGHASPKNHECRREPAERSAKYWRWSFAP